MIEKIRKNSFDIGKSLAKGSIFLGLGMTLSSCSPQNYNESETNKNKEENTEYEIVVNEEKHGIDSLNKVFYNTETNFLESSDGPDIRVETQNNTYLYYSYPHYRDVKSLDSLDHMLTSVNHEYISNRKSGINGVHKYHENIGEMSESNWIKHKQLFNALDTLNNDYRIKN